MFPPQSTPSKRRVESYRIYKRPYSACSQSSRLSPLSYEKATHGKLVGPTLSTPREDKYYNQYRPLCEVCPRDRGKVVGTLQGPIPLVKGVSVSKIFATMLLPASSAFSEKVKFWPRPHHQSPPNGLRLRPSN